uniref:Uncharacterized protein n=1 Tax=Trichobilharzia regenti TaxID=157069 RepID=A0AA85JAW7_TRIRE|nr:unnamed protein product [Trichobilharzia regenti]
MASSDVFSLCNLSYFFLPLPILFRSYTCQTLLILFTHLLVYLCVLFGTWQLELLHFGASSMLNPDRQTGEKHSRRQKQV